MNYAGLQQRSWLWGAKVRVISKKEIAAEDPAAVEKEAE